MESDISMTILIIPNLSDQLLIYSTDRAELTRLYKIPPPADCKTHPMEENRPKIPATMCPWENIAIVLIRPADPAAARQLLSR